MARKAQAPGEKFVPITVEKGIRQTGPSRWGVRVFAGRDPTGAVRHLSRSTTEGIREARRIKAALLAEVARGRAEAEDLGTFGQLLDEWLRSAKWLRSGKGNRAATTHARVELAIRDLKEGAGLSLPVGPIRGQCRLGPVRGPRPQPGPVDGHPRGQTPRLPRGQDPPAPT